MFASASRLYALREERGGEGRDRNEETGRNDEEGGYILMRVEWRFGTGEKGDNLGVGPVLQLWTQTGASPSEHLPRLYRLIEDYSCYNTLFEVSCTEHETLIFESAQYGRNDSEVAQLCGMPYTKTCDIDVQFLLNKACAGRQRCSLGVNSAFFGDPCGYEEFLTIKYYCVPVSVVHSRCPDTKPLPLYNHGYITSPNYPDKYHMDADCRWTIHVQSRQSILLTLFDFELDVRSQGRCHDYLEVISGSDGSVLFKDCGSLGKQVIDMDGSTEALIVFRTGLTSLTHRGFLLHFQAVGPGCPALTQSQGQRLTYFMMDGQREGSSVLYLNVSCETGYQFNDVVTAAAQRHSLPKSNVIVIILKCLDNDHWSNPLPECVAESSSSASFVVQPTPPHLVVYRVHSPPASPPGPSGRSLTDRSAPIVGVTLGVVSSVLVVTLLVMLVMYGCHRKWSSDSSRKHDQDWNVIVNNQHEPPNPTTDVTAPLTETTTVSVGHCGACATVLTSRERCPACADVIMLASCGSLRNTGRRQRNRRYHGNGIVGNRAEDCQNLNLLRSGHEAAEIDEEEDEEEEKKDGDDNDERHFNDASSRPVERWKSVEDGEHSTSGRAKSLRPQNAASIQRINSFAENQRYDAMTSFSKLCDSWTSCRNKPRDTKISFCNGNDFVTSSSPTNDTVTCSPKNNTVASCSHRNDTLASCCLNRDSMLPCSRRGDLVTSLHPRDDLMMTYPLGNDSTAPSPPRGYSEKSFPSKLHCDSMTPCHSKFDSTRSTTSCPPREDDKSLCCRQFAYTTSCFKQNDFLTLYPSRDDLMRSYLTRGDSVSSHQPRCCTQREIALLHYQTCPHHGNITYHQQRSRKFGAIPLHQQSQKCTGCRQCHIAKVSSAVSTSKSGQMTSLNFNQFDSRNLDPNFRDFSLTLPLARTRCHHQERAGDGQDNIASNSRHSIHTPPSGQSEIQRLPHTALNATYPASILCNLTYPVRDEDGNAGTPQASAPGFCQEDASGKKSVVQGIRTVYKRRLSSPSSASGHADSTEEARRFSSLSAPELVEEYEERQMPQIEEETQERALRESTLEE